MIVLNIRKILFPFFYAVAFLFTANSFAVPSSDFPPQPNPPRLVNDFAGMMNSGQQQELERLLVEYDNTSSSQISIVTVKSLGGRDIAEYTIALFNEWQIGQKGKNNGVLVLASLEDRKMWITSGLGMEGALTDAKTGQIVRNEMVPEFKAGNYYQGFRNAAASIIAVTKGEYTNDAPKDGGSGGSAIIFIVIIIGIIAFAAIFGGRGGGGSGGGNYMSRRGSDFVTGAILGSLLGGGGRGGGWGGGSGGFGGSSGGGGFGGFGGGMSGGGGAGGSW